MTQVTDSQLDLMTRYELRNNGNGSSSVVVTRNPTATEEYRPHYVGSRSKTCLTDDVVAERGTHHFRFTWLLSSKVEVGFCQLYTAYFKSKQHLERRQFLQAVKK